MSNGVLHSANGSPEAREDVLVSFHHVSKKFCRNLRRSMAYGLLDLYKNLVGLPLQNDALRTGEFWALNDVSFELRRGETLGVLGLNGSGKTTLLRMVAGIMPPDKGEIMIKGRIGALISMGAGFHPHMTGRENIYLNGSLLGISREELDHYFEDIVGFAEIGEFLDAPVATYSSGMRLRLGFAIATAFVPDVLLLDEVFAVGDVVFRQRCLERIRYMIDNTAVVLVSNRPSFIQMLCSRALWIHRGKIVADGDVEEIASRYEDETAERNAQFAMQRGRSRSGTGAIRFSDDVNVYGSNSESHQVAMRGEQVIVEAPFTCRDSASPVTFLIEMFDLATGMPLTMADCEVPEVTADGILRCTFTKLPMAPRFYAIMLKITSGDTVLDVWRYAALVTVQRLKPRPSSKLRKYPHEIAVEVGEEVFTYTYAGAGADETDGSEEDEEAMSLD